MCCVHDREKRQVTTERQVAELAVRAGVKPGFYKIHRCACCDNLFGDQTDIPRYCHTCRPSRQVHQLAAALNDPIGVVDG